LLKEIEGLETPAADEEFPLVLIGGERRSYNANTIFRDERWRKEDRDGHLKIHPIDGARFGLEDGEWAVCETRRGGVDVRVQFTDEIAPGVVSLPNGYGMEESSDGNGGPTCVTGPAINQLTWSDHCDAIAKTPFHKYLPVRLRPKQVAAS
jgi:anaerobic selenocysteine-containing dehydrogenase